VSEVFAIFNNYPGEGGASCDQWRSVTSSTGYSIISFYMLLGAAEYDSLSLSINIAEQVA